jgi:hypothetical protein
MLHITNGSSVSLAETGLGGEILVWADSLHGGEAPCITDHTEIVLWFEHDLYDQAQLIHVLDQLRHSRANVSLIQSGRYLGPMTPAELAALWPTRRRVTEGEFALGTEAWRAFRSQDTTAIHALLAQNTSALPYLGAALRRHLQQFPSLADGLARTQRQILEILAEAPRAFADLFAEDQKREEAIFLGDNRFREYLKGLNGCIRESEGLYHITESGRTVLAGRAAVRNGAVVVEYPDADTT